jgi:hypothetical protein
MTPECLTMHKEENVFIGQKVSRRERYIDRVMILLCCNADGNYKFHPLTAKKFENHPTWKAYTLSMQPQTY